MEISDTELRERLLALGFVAPPITSTSRAVLLKKLKALETGGQMESTNNSDSAADDEDDADAIIPPYSSVTANIARQRVQKSTFIPENVGMYSRCYVRTVDFWDRIGIIGTTLVLLIASVVLAFVFKSVGDWSERRFRSVHLVDGVYPKCSQGGVPGVSCVPDSDLKFTVDNLNVIRAAVHHATLSERCSHSSFENSDFVGMYPLFKDDVIEKLLTKDLGFKAAEAKKLLQNAKVLFKANALFEMKVLNEGILYRNNRLLRTCGHVSWKDSTHIYALYGVISFALVWGTYKLNRWVNKLRTDGDQERRRLVKDIFDILKQNDKQSDCNFVGVNEVREWISSVVKLRPKLWEEVMVYLKEHDTGILIEKRNLHGEECDVFRIQK